MDRYTVFGNPIEHSKSPQIHAAFAQQTEQEMEYDRTLAEIGKLPVALDRLRDRGGKGCNITVPFKQDAWQLADERTPRAERAGAVNTLLFREDNILYGDNTDGVGLVRDLTKNLGILLQGKRILVLGAGGAVRGILEPILEAKPAQVFVANRTPERAHELVRLFYKLGEIDGDGFDALNGKQFDLVINGTAASLQGDLPPLPDDLLAPDAACYDLMYAKEPTPFMRWATEHNAKIVSDGLGMLVEQAAESFFLWRGVRPQTAEVIRMLRVK